MVLYFNNPEKIPENGMAFYFTDFLLWRNIK